MIRNARHWLALHENAILLGVLIGIELHAVGGALGLSKLLWSAATAAPRHESFVTQAGSKWIAGGQTQPPYWSTPVYCGNGAKPRLEEFDGGFSIICQVAGPVDAGDGRPSVFWP